MSNKVSLTIVIPAYNEENNISATIGLVIKAVRIAKIHDHKLIVVNDASTDKTKLIVEKIAIELDCVELINNERNLGFGGSCKKGFKMSKTEYVMYCPGDNNHTVEDLIRIMSEIGKADIASTYRANAKTRNKYRVFLSNFNSKILNFMFGLKVPYYNGITIYKKADLDEIQIVTNSFAWQPETLIKLLKKGCSVVFVSVEGVPLPKIGSEAFNFFNIIKVIFTIFRLFFSISLDHIFKFLDKSFGWIIPSRYMRYCTVASIGLLISFSFLFLFYKVVNIDYRVALGLAMLLSVAISFFLQRKTTFRDKSLRGKSVIIGLLMFYTFLLIGSGINYSFSIYVYGLAPDLWLLAPLAGSVLTSIWNFVTNNFITWKK